MHDIVVLKDGVISERGTFDTLLQKGGAFADFLKTYFAELGESGEDEEEGEEEEDAEDPESMHVDLKCAGCCASPNKRNFDSPSSTLKTRTTVNLICCIYPLSSCLRCSMSFFSNQNIKVD